MGSSPTFGTFLQGRQVSSEHFFGTEHAIRDNPLNSRSGRGDCFEKQTTLPACQLASMLVQYIIIHMKAITLNVSEPVYADFQRFAKEQDRPTSELLREAMELYRKAKIRPVKSLRELNPSSAGALLQSWSGRGDLLTDFLE